MARVVAVMSRGVAVLGAPGANVQSLRVREKTLR